MPAENRENQPSGMDRRQWMASAAALAAGAAAAPFISGDAEAAGRPAPPDKTAPRTIIAPNCRQHRRDRVREDSRFLAERHPRVQGHSRTPRPRRDAARYMAPAKPAAWTGVRSCMALGFACPQGFHVPEGRRAGWTHDEEAFMFEWDDGQPGEDCLRVNVWTPSTSDTHEAARARLDPRRRLHVRFVERAADVRRREPRAPRRRRRRQPEPSARPARLHEPAGVRRQVEQRRQRRAARLRSRRSNGSATTSAASAATRRRSWSSVSPAAAARSRR